MLENCASISSNELEALRISEQRYRRMVETAEEGIRILDADGRTVYVNPRFAAMLGLAADDILGREAREFIHPDEIPDYEQCKQRRKAGLSGQYERRMLHADGSTIWTRVSATPILDERNIYAGSFAMFSDITEIKRIERELRDNEARLQAITDNAQDAIVMMDHHGLISFWNPAAEVIFGYSADKAMGQNLHELLAPQRYHAAHHCAFPRFLQCGQGQAVGKTLELEALHRGGREISIELSLSSIYVQGHWHALGIVRDVSARKKAEHDLCEANDRLQDAMERAKSMAHQAQAANDEKSRFLTTMSHEIRTPLNGVLGMAQLLQKTRLNDEQQRYVNVIRSSGDSLLNLINDILDFSKIEAGRLELVEEDFDPRQLVEEVGQMLALLVQECDISVTWESTPQTPRLVHGDMSRVRQILLNLGSNAVKFTDKGRIRLEVFPVSRHKDQVQLRFQVHDTGIGIADEKIPQLFETFFQVDTSITRKYGGTGLGLAISRRLAEMMGGEIGVESREKQGSMFWFTVNLRLSTSQAGNAGATPGGSESSTQAQAGQECSPASTQCSSARVLLVEDNQVNQLVARRMLSKMGVDADVAHNGLEAVQATQGQRYDLILMDIEMPIMDGLEATQRIREAEAEEGDRTPIIALTAHAIQGDRERFLVGGMDDYLTKPLNYAAFAEKMSAWLTGEARQTRNTDKA